MNKLLSVRLTALNGVGKVNIKKANGDTVECLAIPIKANCINQSNNGDYYLNMVGWESDKLKDGKTHLLKLSIPEDVRKFMTQDELNNQPILGDMKNLEAKKKEIETYSVASEPASRVEPEDKEDDLPFGTF